MCRLAAKMYGKDTVIIRNGFAWTLMLAFIVFKFRIPKEDMKCQILEDSYMRTVHN